MSNQFLNDAETEMQQSLEATQRELSQIRTGRATPALLDGIMVDAYGTPTPLRQLANVSVPEARLMVVQPWDKSLMGEIEKAIQKSELGVNPNNDGKLIRLNFPPLTEDRRKEIVKMTKKIGEDGKVSIRHHRRDSIESLKKAQKEGTFSEDESKALQDEVQKITDKYSNKIDDLLKEKENEIMNF